MGVFPLHCVSALEFWLKGFSSEGIVVIDRTFVQLEDEWIHAGL